MLFKVTYAYIGVHTDVENWASRESNILLCNLQKVNQS